MNNALKYPPYWFCPVKRVHITSSGITNITLDPVNSGDNIDIQQKDGITEQVSSTLESLEKFSVSLADAHNGAKSGYRSLSVINMESKTGNLLKDFTAANMNDQSNMVNGKTISGMLTENGFLLINIDATGQSSYTLDKFVVDGQDPDGTEDLSRHVIYNFVQKKNGSYEPYTGTITVNNVAGGVAGGVILAPAATVIHNGGIRGEVIADTYNFESGSELHKDTLTTQNTAEVKVSNGTTGKKNYINVNIEANKTLDGKTPDDSKKFTFQLTNSAGTVEGIATNNADGKITFDAIKFPGDTDAEYKYKLSEVVPDGAVDNVYDGVKYDTTTHNVTVTVKNGTAAVTYDDGKTEAPTFNNTSLEGCDVQLKAVKHINGKSPDGASYRFQLLDSNGTVLQTKTNDADGNIVFDKISYNSEGTYSYKIKEVLPEGVNKDNKTKDGITYDTADRNVTVKVAKNGNKLVPEVTYENRSDKAVFNNETKASVSIKARKELNGAAPGNNTFKFELIGKSENTSGTDITATNGEDGSISFENIDYTEPGKYYYVISETKDNKGNDNIIYDTNSHSVTVTVNRSEKTGALSASVEYDNNSKEAPVFRNTEKARASIVAEKKLYGRTLEKGEFKFRLTEGEKNPEQTLEGGSVERENSADGNIDFGTIKYTKAGTYTYTISEKIPEDAKKFEKDGKTYYEKNGVTYDTKSHSVKVVVENSNGRLIPRITYDGDTETNAPVFTNKYSTKDGQASISAKKVLTGKPLTDGEFTFKLTEGEKNPEQTLEGGSVERENSADGNIDFGTIKYTKAGTYTYTISEKIPADAKEFEKDGKTYYEKDGITYDENNVAVKVVVKDNGSGQLETSVTYNGNTEPATFRNTYNVKPVLVRFHGTKTVTEGNTTGDVSGLAGLFRFDLSENGKVIDTAKNDADGRFYFKNLRFDSTGEHTYTISEQHGGETRVVDGRKVTYDSRKYTVTVKVTKDKNNGQYVATVSGDTGSFNFNNQIKEDDKVTVRANKQLIGGTLRGGEFTFELYRKNASGEAVGDPVAVTTNTSDGRIIFEEVDSCDTGFVIREVKGSDSGITYDTSDHPVDFKDGEQTSVPTITNTSQKIVVRLKKSSIDPTSGNEPLYKAVYALHRINSAGEDELIEKQTSDENGYMYYTKLEPGYVYYFKEVSAPAGHTVEPAPSQYFKIVSTGSGIRAIPCDRDGNATGGSDYTVTLKNSGEIAIVKDKDDITESNSQYYYEDGDVKASAKSLVSGALPEGAELKVEKLEPGSDAYEKAVSRIDSSSVKGTALSLYNVYFVTKDGTKVEPDAGSVSVTIQDKSEPAVSSKDKLGIVHVAGDGSVSLLDGTVAVSGGRAEQGTFSAESFSVFGLMEVESSTSEGGELVIDTDGVQDHVTELRVGKRDSLSGEYVKGARLQILEKKSDGSEVLIREWMSSDVDRESFTKLLDVNTVYILREVQAPAGYDTAPDTEFSIDDYGNVSVYTNDGQVSYDHAQRTEVADSATLDLYDTKLAIHKTVYNKKYVKRGRVVKTYKSNVKYVTASSRNGGTVGGTTAGGSAAGGMNAQTFVKTGDTMNTLFWAVALLAAADALLVAAIRRRREKNRTGKSAE